MYKKPKVVINTSDWPVNNGCNISETPTMLYKGNHIDRFGSDYGFFFGIAGEPYIHRSLPWFGNYIPNDISNNNAIKQNFYKFYSQADVSLNPEYDYHLYKVIKPFQMNSCVISPAFGFPGGGTQYRSNINAKELIQQGFIKEVPWVHEPFFDDKDDGIINGGKNNTFKSKHYKRKTKRKIHKKSKTTRKNSK
jgi:hypothetical protein